MFSFSNSQCDLGQTLSLGTLGYYIHETGIMVLMSWDSRVDGTGGGEGLRL